MNLVAARQRQRRLNDRREILERLVPHELEEEIERAYQPASDEKIADEFDRRHVASSIDVEEARLIRRDLDDRVARRVRARLVYPDYCLDRLVRPRAR